MNTIVELELAEDMLCKIEEFSEANKLSFDEVVELAVKKLFVTGNKKYITPEDIQNVIASIDYNAIPDSTILLCVITLKNGAKVIGKNYGSIDPTRYNYEVAKEMSFKDAVEKIWELEGYLLRQQLYEKNLVSDCGN